MQGRVPRGVLRAHVSAVEQEVLQVLDVSVPASLGRDKSRFWLLHQRPGKVFSREGAVFTEGLIFRITPGSLMGAQIPRCAFLHQLPCGHFRCSNPVLELNHLIILGMAA